MILVSLALAGCNFGSVSSSATDSSVSDITTTEVTSDTIESSLPSSEGDTSESSSEGRVVDGHALRTVADLELLRDFPDEDFHLLRDIDLAGIEWVPIPVFSGKFFGHYNKILNLTIAESSHALTGFFAVIDGAHIVDLTFENVEIAVHIPEEPVAYIENAVGVLAGMQQEKLTSRGTYIENVHVQDSPEGRAVINLIDDGTKPENALEIAGGLIGVSEGALTIHTVFITLTISGAVGAGGLIGLVNGDHVIQISNSNINGDFLGSMFAGGFIGFADEGAITIFSSVNYSGVSAGLSGLGDFAFAGGFVGGIVMGTLAIQNSKNGGFVSNSQSTGSQVPMGAGGFIGMAASESNVSLVNVHNSVEGEVTINIGDNAGGLIGFLGDVNSLTISKSWNSAPIKAQNQAGGLIALIVGAESVMIANSYNNGIITAGKNGVGGTAGGFVARVIEADVTINNSYNNAEVQTTISFAGGFFGMIFEGIVTLNNVLHVGQIVGSQYVGTFAGDTSYNLQITNSYYNATFMDWFYEVPDFKNYQGAEVLLANINNDFFTTTLGWDKTIWQLTNIDSSNLPTLI